MNAVRVAERLDPARFHLSFACFNAGGALRSRILDAGLSIDEFPVGSLQGPGFIREGRRFRAFLRREQVDVVHAHDRYANIFAAPWARLARTPAIITSKRWGNISRVHGVGNRVAYRLAHRVLGNSNAVGASLSTQDGVAPSRVVVIPNFVDDHAFVAPSDAWMASMRAELALAPDALVVGIVANLRAIKDHATLLRAIAEIAPQFPSLALVIIGAGDQREPLAALAESLQLSNVVRFAGNRPNQPNPHFLFDVSVLTSTSEGFPNSIVEAMAAGRPVVATEVGGVPDAVTDGRTGLLVPARDSAALARALASVLADAPRREAMGLAGRERARADFAAAEVIHLVESLYESMLHGRVA